MPEVSGRGLMRQKWFGLWLQAVSEIEFEQGLRGQILAAEVFWAQVAEWLMAADCKSATLRVTEVRILPCAP